MLIVSNEQFYIQRGLPTPQFARAYADLAMAAGGDLMAAMFGKQGGAVLAGLYLTNHTLYSSDKAIFSLEIGEKDGGEKTAPIVGMVSGFTYQQQQQQDADSTRALLRLMGWGAWRPMVVAGGLAWRGVRMGDVEAGQYYIQTVAIYPQWRGRGISRLLLDAVRQRAAALDCRQLVLDVGADNATAIAAYRRFGFVMTRQTPQRRPMVARMVYPLGASGVADTTR